MCSIKKCPFLTASFKEAIEQITKWQALKFQLLKDLNYIKSLKKNNIAKEGFLEGEILALETIIKKMEDMENKLK